jgi:hypothetical protein
MTIRQRTVSEVSKIHLKEIGDICIEDSVFRHNAGEVLRDYLKESHGDRVGAMKSYLRDEAYIRDKSDTVKLKSGGDRYGDALNGVSIFAGSFTISGMALQVPELEGITQIADREILANEDLVLTKGLIANPPASSDVGCMKQLEKVYLQLRRILFDPNGPKNVDDIDTFLQKNKG